MNRREILKYAAVTAAGSLAVNGANAQEPGGELYSFWTHGNVVQPENPNALQSIVRIGWGTQIRGKSGAASWFHIAIPTSTELGNRHIQLAAVYLLFKVDGASVRNLHVYDGPRKIKAFDGLPIKPREDLTTGIVPGNTWAINPPLAISFGVSLAINVQFSAIIDGSATGPLDILFSGAGADFRTETPKININQHFLPQKKR